MLRETCINLNNFFLSVSDAIDLANPAISLHQMRTTYIAWQLAKEAILPYETCRNIYMAALFHDIGALDPREKLLLHRFETEKVDSHCVIGEQLLASIWILAPAAPIVRYHHLPWKIWRQKGARLTDPYVFESQILYLADFVERSINRQIYILSQIKNIINKVKNLKGEDFHPEVVDLFEDLAKREAFWFDITNPRIYSLLLNRGPLEKVEIDIDSVARLSRFFSRIIDFRSRFTATHSVGVASTAVMISKYLRFTEKEITLIQIAGNLHDLGKLAIPVEVLEKPSKLTPAEIDIVKKHPYYTYVILDSIEGFEQVTEWAAFHHEKLDGTGYPFRLTAGDLSLGARILAVADVFTALLENRPYRQELSQKEIYRIMTGMAQRRHLDSLILEALFDNYSDISVYVKEKQEASQRQFEEMQSLSLMSQESPYSIFAGVNVL